MAEEDASLVNDEDTAGSMPADAATTDEAE